MHDFSRCPALALLSPDVIAAIKFAVVFGSGNEAVFVTVDDKVYVFCTVPNTTKPLLIEKLSNIGVVDIRPGFASIFVALTKNGELYYCGQKNTFPKAAFVSEPTARYLDFPTEKFVKVSCGLSHAVAISEAGGVFFWGNDTVRNQVNQVKVSSGISGIFVKDVECGANFTILVSDGGQPYGFGNNANYQLGVGHNVNQQNPVKISGIENVFISQVVCGYYHAMVLSADGLICGWGYNSYGQLATGNAYHQPHAIRIATKLNGISQIAAVNKCNVSAAITKSNEVYIWGLFRGQSFLKPHLTSLNCIDDVFSCLTEPCVSFRPLAIEVNFIIQKKNDLLHCLKNSFEDPKTSNVTFVVEGKQIHAHKDFLKIRCDHFRLMFQESVWLESSKKEVEITQYSYPVFKAFLHYLYTDELNLTAESAIGLLDLETSYLETDLKSKCADEIKKMISIENSILFYDSSRRYKDKELEEFCFCFCMDNMSAVTLTEHFEKLDETTFKHFVIEASKRGAWKK